MDQTTQSTATRAIEEALAELGQIPGLGGDLDAIRENATRARAALRAAHFVLAPRPAGKLLAMPYGKEARR